MKKRTLLAVVSLLSVAALTFGGCMPQKTNQATDVTKDGKIRVSIVATGIDDKNRTKVEPVRRVEPVVVAEPEAVIEEIAEEMNMPVERVREILKISQEPVSLETPIGEEEDSHLGDFIPDDEALSPADAASISLLKEQLAEVLKTLTPREEKVLSLRYGLEDGHPRTLEEVGKEFNVTRERIRQIEAKALRKLRHPSRSKKVKDFLDE